MSRSVSTQQRWRRIIRQQQSSGLTVAAFCRRRTVPLSSFYAWKRRLGCGGTSAFVVVEAIEDGSNNGSAEGSGSNGALEDRA